MKKLPKEMLVFKGKTNELQDGRRMSKEWELIKNIYGCTTILMQEEEAKETQNAFKVVEKSLKALDIIKEKNVDIKLLKLSMVQYGLQKV